MGNLVSMHAAARVLMLSSDAAAEKQQWGLIMCVGR